MQTAATITRPIRMLAAITLAANLEVADQGKTVSMTAFAGAGVENADAVSGLDIRQTVLPRKKYSRPSSVTVPEEMELANG
jgi:hypothetical protein